MAAAPLDSPGAFLRQVVGYVLPSLIYADDEVDRYRSFTDQLSTLWRELGYMHLQSTRPDTVGE